MRICVVIPAYKCEKQITRVLEGFDESLRAKIERVKVIENRSPDSTLDCVVEYTRGAGWTGFIEVWRNNNNYGLGGTHKVAFLAAIHEGYDYLAILHGDAQALTSDLARLIDYATKHPDCAAVLGARFMRGSKLTGYSTLRTWGNHGLNMLYSLLSFKRTYDMGSGLNLFRVKDLKEMDFLGFQDAFTFNHDLLLTYFRRRAKVAFVPISWFETDQISNAKTFQVGWKALKTLLDWRMGREVRIQGKKPSDYESTQVL
jgi:glycosyltransferase involved in cell wall biosynthesis